MTPGTILLGNYDIRREQMPHAGIETKTHDRLGNAKINGIHDRLMRDATGGLWEYRIAEGNTL